MEINIPELSLVLLIGASGSGKSSFALKHFSPYEVVSSDNCRGIVSNDENSQEATTDAFDLVHYIIEKRLKNGLLTVVDATNVQMTARKSLIQLARKYHTLPTAIVLDLPKKVCEARNTIRPDRNFGSHVIRQQQNQLKRSLKGLKREGFRKIYVLRSEEEIERITGIAREKLYSNKQDITGPFDLIGDIHGCYDELIDLLHNLGYTIHPVADDGRNFGIRVNCPGERKIVFLGDLVDRGPNSPAVLKLVMNMVAAGTAFCVPGNHDMKLQKKLSGKNVKVRYGLEETLEQLSQESPEFSARVKEFLYSLVSHYVFDGGKLVVAHAGLKEEMQGRGSAAVRSFCQYGETTGETDEFGLPVRYNWAAEYRGKAKVVYGHTPIPTPEWLNRTIDIDTGCVFGGSLTALRYPEADLISVPAKKTYCEPIRPLHQNQTELSQQQEYDDLLDIDDVIGKRIVQTRLRNNITLQEENSIAALEVMSRFAVNPKWLIYLPPTMSPCETSNLPQFLEHPEEALGYYRNQGIERVVCEEKHMGSRAVLILCRDNAAAQKHFGVTNGRIGVCYTRTGRNFFTNPEMEQAFLRRIVQACDTSGFWKKHQTEWVCLDTELMPWSAKAQALLKEQYASVGTAASHALSDVENILKKAAARNLDGAQLLYDKFHSKQASIEKYRAAYRQYCWDVTSIEDYKLAPFHILATEGSVHVDKDHTWHMENIKELCQADEQLLRITPYQVIETQDERCVQQAIAWWLDLTERGGEGMVVKPYDFISYGKQGLVQPAVKCRGREYLRIIYGPEYDHPANLSRLKKRGLSRKRSLALREFALGIEGLERLMKKEPLRRIHESVFGVLALESEAVDPRL
ncbi:MAG: polynucleotide kinase-phosphatase [Candidatus Electrothrix scaldis]|nr:MAG: polynucleotide kinase-phosphatase [Candidatus Electrothrix sp. GW3-3]